MNEKQEEIITQLWADVYMLGLKDQGWKSLFAKDRADTAVEHAKQQFGRDK